MNTANLDMVAKALTDKDVSSEQQVIAQVGIEWLATLLRKNDDYGNSVFRSPVLARKLSPGDACLVRMSDKIERLDNLINSGAKPQVAESIDDTISDLGAYCLLYLAGKRIVDEDTKPSDS